MKFYADVWGGEMNKVVDFGSDPDHYADCLNRKSNNYSSNYEHWLRRSSLSECSCFILIFIRVVCRPFFAKNNQALQYK